MPLWTAPLLMGAMLLAPLSQDNAMIRHLSEQEFQHLYPHLDQVAWDKPEGTLCRLIVLRHGESTSNASQGEIRIARKKV